jgi:serine phosphatase RsbU (regulator of sigma subunit)
MGRVKRAFLVLGWTLKSLLMKLSPRRRILLLASLVFMIAPQFQFEHFSLDLRPLGFLLLLVVLMLELKDKLLARDEIEIARQVQLALLPRQHPSVPGWAVWSCSRPANDVGGDLVDYVDLDGFRHGVVLGDVAGKGLGAALLTAKVQATLRALVPEAASLDDLGGRVNKILHRDGLDNRFATLFYAVLEHHSGRLCYLNAGHNPVFVLHEGRVERLGASAAPLGMLDTSEYREGQLELQRGDLLLAYSDGLTEAANPQGEEFGAARVEALLPRLVPLDAAAAGQCVLDEVDRFLGASRPADDLSLVIIRKM